VLVLGACVEDPPVASDPTGGSFPSADAVTISGEYYFSNAQGIRASHLRFDTLYTWNDSINSEARGPALTIFNEDGSQRALVTSREGIIDSRFESFIARGSVVLDVPAQMLHLETEELRYDSQTDQISTDTCFLLMREGQAPLRGSRFRSDIEFQSIQAENTGGCG
jgi:LPS export ABC transporter protein LptC